MLLLTSAFALFASTAAVQAAVHQVDVGNGGLTYTPNTVTAVAQDTIVFTFKSGSHTVTQSTFASPCSPLTGGVDSGTVTIGTQATPPTYNYTVSGTDPTWFYCKTSGHCKAGMVFAINPTADKTFAAFQAAAQKGTANGRSSVSIGVVAAALLFGGMSAL